MRASAAGSLRISGASWAWTNRAGNICIAMAPPRLHCQSMPLVGAESIHAAFSPGGRFSAAALVHTALCDVPTMPTRPLLQGCAASHSTVS